MQPVDQRVDFKDVLLSVSEAKMRVFSWKTSLWNEPKQDLWFKKKAWSSVRRYGMLQQQLTFHAHIVISQQAHGVLVSVYLCLHERDVEVCQQTQTILQPSFTYHWLPLLLCQLFAVITDIEQTVTKILKNKPNKPLQPVNNHKGAFKRQNSGTFGKCLLIPFANPCG